MRCSRCRWHWKRVRLQSTARIRGDHTAAYAFLDEVHCGLLYGVPDGMGIQFGENSYLEDAANPVYAGMSLQARAAIQPPA